MITALARRLAAELPDVPRWVETRAMLRSPGASIAGGPAAADGFVVRVVHGALSAVSVAGEPPCDAIARAIDGVTAMTPLIAQADNAAHVARCLGDGWRAERAVLHCLRAGAAPPQHDAGTAVVRLLTPSDPLDHLPPGLGHEMTHARTIAPIAAAFVDGSAASFCYPCWVTESWWDVSIDTLEAFRGRALGAAATRFMIEHMRREGREPIWGALESNAASLRLAAKLGFAPVGEVVVFSRGTWAYFTAGFTAG